MTPKVTSLPWRAKSIPFFIELIKHSSSRISWSEDKTSNIGSVPSFNAFIAASVIAGAVPLENGSNNIVLNSNGSVSFPNNENIIQVVQTHKTDTSVYYNVDANSYTPVFIDRSITMTDSSNKVLVICTWWAGYPSTNNGQTYTLYRG